MVACMWAFPVGVVVAVTLVAATQALTSLGWSTGWIWGALWSAVLVGVAIAAWWWRGNLVRSGWMVGIAAAMTIVSILTASFLAVL